MVDFTRQKAVEEMLSSQPLCDDDEHCMKPSELEGLRRLTGNQRCIDCGKEDPDWASISLGIFMCLQCSGYHRSLGTHVSKIRSVRMDSWSPEQLGLMKCAGNQQCLEFLARHKAVDVTSSNNGQPETIAQRYDCAAAMLYQKVLKARRDGAPEPTEMPDYTPSRRSFISKESMGSHGSPIKRSKDPNILSASLHSLRKGLTGDRNINLQEQSKKVERAMKNSQQVVVTKAKGLFQTFSMHVSPRRENFTTRKVASSHVVSNMTDDSSISDDETVDEFADSVSQE